MENIAPTARAACIAYFTKGSMDQLNSIWHATADRAIELDLTTAHFNAMEPLMEYYVDGIDEAADDDNQTNLKALVAGSVHDLQLCIMAHEKNLPGAENNNPNL